MRNRLARPFIAPAFLLCFTAGFLPACAQTNQNKTLENSSNTIPLKAVTTPTVNSCIHVEAVLLSKKLASMLFGGFVGVNYAVVKTTVSNRCDDQQFILHDVYFDYRKWALSGVFADFPVAPSTDSKPPNNDATPLTGSAGLGGDPSAEDKDTASTQPGQVATVGALDVQDQDAEDAIWSPRNKVIKSLALVGQVASGYAFLWSGDAAKGIGAYNSGFVENLTNIWPDRRIDQEKNILALGYRTDRSTAIAKDDHGSYYAFFPLKVFLSATLTRLFLDSPAMFLSSPQILLNQWLDPPSKWGLRKDKDTLVNLLLDLSDQVDAEAKALYSPAAGQDATCTGDVDACKKIQATTPTTAAKDTISTEDTDVCKSIQSTTPTAGKDKASAEACKKAKIARLLVDLSSPCPGSTPGQCPLSLTNPVQKYSYYRILGEKSLFKGATLNSVQIVVRGVMTISVDAVPPMIERVAFDEEKSGAALWTVKPAAAVAPVSGEAQIKGKTAKPSGAAAPAPSTSANPTDAATTAKTKCTATNPPKTLVGTITGKFLASGTPTIEALNIPGDPTADKKCYIGTITADPLKSSDASLPFSMQLLASLPNGSKLSFVVTRNVGSTGTSDTGSGAASKQLSSIKFDYTVQYEADKNTTSDASHIDDVVIAGGTLAGNWQQAEKMTGTVTGTNLTGGTVEVRDILVDEKSASPTKYTGTITTTPGSATMLTFELPLLKTNPIPAAAKLIFVVNTKSGSGGGLSSNTFQYPVPKGKAQGAANQATTNASKKIKAGAPKNEGRKAA